MAGRSRKYIKKSKRIGYKRTRGHKHMGGYKRTRKGQTKRMAKRQGKRTRRGGTRSNNTKWVNENGEWVQKREIYGPHDPKALREMEELIRERELNRIPQWLIDLKNKGKPVKSNTQKAYLHSGDYENASAPLSNDYYEGNYDVTGNDPEYDNPDNVINQDEIPVYGEGPYVHDD